MSRRPPPAATEDVCPGDPTRRLVIGAAAVTPLIPGPARAADPAVQACETWLIRCAEHESLAIQWSQLESRLHHQHNWLKLTRAQQRRYPESRELEDLDDQIEALSLKNSALLKALPAVVATSPLGICGKLTIVAHETKHEGEEIHELIVSILRDYRALHGG